MGGVGSVGRTETKRVEGEEGGRRYEEGREEKKRDLKDAKEGLGSTAAEAVAGGGGGDR